MRCVRVLGFALLLAVPACKAAELGSDAAFAPDGDVAPDGGADADVDVGTPPVLFGCTPISESVREGCRSSDEPGCASCCRQTSADSCAMWLMPCGTSIAGQSIGGYCSAISMPGQCPAGCSTCAACSKSSEATICSLMPTIGACDCANVDITNDPCISPQGCGCLCQQYLGALKACPP